MSRIINYEIDNRVIELFKIGKSYKEIMKDLNIKLGEYYNIANRYGLLRRIFKRKFSPNIEKQICREYVSGVICEDLGYKYECSHGLISDILNRNHVPARDISTAARGKYFLNEECFSDLTPETLYWVGFLACDGNVSSIKGSYSIRLSLQKRDQYVLEQFRLFAESNHRILGPYNGQMSYGFNSKTIGKRLIDLGVTPRKTYNLKLHESVVNSPALWLGAIEADGSVERVKRSNRSTIDYRMRLTSASPEFVEQWRTFCYSILGKDRLLVYKKPDNKAVEARLNTNPARKIARYLIEHSGCKPKLLRKWKNIDSIDDLL